MKQDFGLLYKASDICPSVNSFKLHTGNLIRDRRVLQCWPPGLFRTALWASWDYNGRDHFRYPNFRSWSMRTYLANAFAVVCLLLVSESHLSQ